MNAAKYNGAETSYRTPTDYEKERIAAYFRAYYASSIKCGKVMSRVLTVVGLLMMGSIGLDTNKTTGVSIAVGLLCFFLVYKFVRSKNRCIAENQAFAAGRFSVADGVVTKIETNLDTPGCCNICFLSDDGEISGGWLRVREENVAIGSHILLMRPEDKCSFPVFAFSDFMLTDEGIKLHW